MTAKVINPVWETFFEAETTDECFEWIETFARDTDNTVIETGPGTYKVGSFNLYIREG